MGDRTLTLLAGATAATAGDKTAVNVGSKTPFLPGRKMRAIFDARGQVGTAPIFQIDGSNDNSTWVADVADSDVVLGATITAVDVTCYEYMRVTVTTAAGTTAGTLGVHLEAP